MKGENASEEIRSFVETRCKRRCSIDDFNDGDDENEDNNVKKKGHSVNK